MRDANLVVLAVPLHRFHLLDPESFSGKIVIHVMNYWPEVDGLLDAFEDPSRPAGCAADQPGSSMTVA